MRLFVLIAAVTVAITCGGICFADDIAAARMHYERGTTLFDLQRYAEAAKEYEAAFEAKSDPALLFNIGQAYRFAGDYAKALAAYRSYLRRVPEAENRSDVERRITELQKLNDDQKRTARVPSSPTTPPERTAEPTVAPSSARQPASRPESSSTTARRRNVKLPTGIAVAAVGVVAIAVGAAFEGLAASANRSLTNPSPGATFDTHVEQTLKTDETVGPILLSVGCPSASRPS